MSTYAEEQVWEELLNTLDVGACVCPARSFIRIFTRNGMKSTTVGRLRP
jgi:hypothetical protein